MLKHVGNLDHNVAIHKAKVGDVIAQAFACDAEQLRTDDSHTRTFLNSSLLKMPYFSFLEFSKYKDMEVQRLNDFAKLVDMVHILCVLGVNGKVIIPCK